MPVNLALAIDRLREVLVPVTQGSDLLLEELGQQLDSVEGWDQ